MGTFIVENWAGVASVLGAILSALAFWQAATAARNARRTSEQVREVRSELAKRTLAEELGSLRQLVEPAMALISAADPQAASALIQRGQYTISLMLSRWSGVLGDKQRTCLVRAGTQLKSARKVLAGRRLDGETRARCLDAAEKALHSIIEAQGLALAEADHL
jgi:hypothetical protein